MVSMENRSDSEGLEKKVLIVMYLN